MLAASMALLTRVNEILRAALTCRRGEVAESEVLTGANV